MVAFFHIEDIDLGSASHSSGHEAYLNAVYNPPDKKRVPFKIIYKKNKYGLPEFSRSEVMFSQLARLFLLSNLTPPENLVVDKENTILGLAVQHLCYVIENKEGLQHNFYALEDPQAGCIYTPLKVRHPTKIPIYFFDKLPQGFFALLVEAESDGLLTIDYDSLASLLATSYTLEEDDLHKGNYGFYLIERHGKPRVVFFKIDHDLMFVDSIMAFRTQRLAHLAQGAHAFDITVDDLLSLTCLKDSSNSYWPTKFGYFSSPFDNKQYHNYADIDAFVRLSRNRQFVKAKWKSFCKHILIPQELMEQTLRQSTDLKNAADRAEVALITQATAARLARLRAALFSIEEFRDYLREINEEETQALIQDVIPIQFATKELLQQVHTLFAHYKELCHAKNGFTKGDTPLHTAIKLGEYRYEETLNMFGQFINVKNKAGKTPLDVALERLNSVDDDETDVRKNMHFIIKHLLKNGARKTTNYMESGIDLMIKGYTFKNPYLEGITTSMPYKQFKTILRDIGEDHRFGLKFKKRLAVECIRRFIKVNKNHPDADNRLLQLRDDINGYSSEEDCAGVKYIRQLRSRLWIIRQLRGLYGLTSTQWEINEMISRARERPKAKEPNCFSFFLPTRPTAILSLTKDFEHKIVRHYP